MVGLIVLVVLFGGISISAAFNIWRTESSKIPAKIERGEFAGQADPSDIRGSYSLADLQKAFEVPVDVLARAFGVSHVEDAAAFKCKQLEDIYANLPDGREIGTDSVRLFVALYKGLPHTPEDSTSLPNPAVSILKELGTLTEEQIALVDRIRFDITEYKDEAAAATREDHEEEAEDDRTIKGKTTFGELLSWGLSKEAIEEVFGMKIGARGTTMRDYCADKGVEFSEYKVLLQEKVDALE
jgi:hypothetical protein